MRRAVIDIGTNTVKLLVADVGNGVVTPVVEKAATTRIGEGVHQTNRLLPAAIERTVKVIGQYAEEAKMSGATDILAFTTSAARTATNADEFLRACPVTVEVISGEKEAELIFRGAASDPQWAGQRLLVMDVGGGSAEWILGQAGTMDKLQSLPVGVVRLLERFGEDDFAGITAFLRAEFASRLELFRSGLWRMIGTGGTIVTLARIAGQSPDHARLSLDAIRALVTHLNALPLAERKRVPGLPPERADIIVPGGMVFVTAMETLGAMELTVSVRALRYGALLA